MRVEQRLWERLPVRARAVLRPLADSQAAAQDSAVAPAAALVAVQAVVPVVQALAGRRQEALGVDSAAAAQPVAHPPGQAALEGHPLRAAATRAATVSKAARGGTNSGTDWICKKKHLHRLGKMGVLFRPNSPGPYCTTTRVGVLGP